MSFLTRLKLVLDRRTVVDQLGDRPVIECLKRRTVDPGNAPAGGKVSHPEVIIGAVRVHPDDVVPCHDEQRQRWGEAKANQTRFGVTFLQKNGHKLVKNGPDNTDT